MKGAAFEEDDLKGYIDERISDLSKSLDSSDPLGQYDQYRKDLKNWDDKIDQAWANKQADGRTTATSTANNVIDGLQTIALNARDLAKDEAQDSAEETARVAYEEAVLDSVRPTLTGLRTSARCRRPPHEVLINRLNGIKLNQDSDARLAYKITLQTLHALHINSLNGIKFNQALLKKL